MSASDAWRRAAIAAALFMALDQITKQIAVTSIKPGDDINIFFGLDLTNVRNTGVAFGAFAGGGALVSVLTIAALTLLVVYFTLRSSTPWLWLPVGIIAGGALGNLADRARGGAVIDFIDPVLWPAFNLADMGIVLGILGLLYVMDKR